MKLSLGGVAFGFVREFLNSVCDCNMCEEQRKRREGNMFEGRRKKELNDVREEKVERLGLEN